MKSGKTTVARLFARILYDTKMRKLSTYEETTGQVLKDKGVDKFREVVKKAKHGVLFIDEAYVLDPDSNQNGKSIVVELMAVAENERDKHSFVIAGYQKDMFENFFSFNEGLKSRFEEVLFEDFSPKELGKIWEGFLESNGWRCDDDVINVAVRRLEKKIGTKGFGNARGCSSNFREGARCCCCSG